MLSNYGDILQPTDHEAQPSALPNSGAQPVAHLIAEQTLKLHSTMKSCLFLA